MRTCSAGALPRASCPGELRPQRGSCLLLSPGFHKIARGGKCREGGAVEPVSLLQAGWAGLLHGNGWVKSSLDGCQGGMVPRCGEQAAVWAAETLSQAAGGHFCLLGL